MEMINTEDQRFCTAEDAIFGALEQLAESKPLDRISVADITKRAGIVRSTFYNHYVDMPSLLLQTEEKMLDDIFAIIDKFHPRKDEDICSRCFLTLCRYIKSSAFMVQLIRSPYAPGFMEKALERLHAYARHMLSGAGFDAALQEREVSYAIAYSLGGVLGILHKWTAEDCADSEETVAGIITRIYLDGIRNFSHGTSQIEK